MGQFPDSLRQDATFAGAESSAHMDLVMIDYGAGNVQSVRFALERQGFKAELSHDSARVARADKVIFPGVGAAKSCMEALKRYGLDELIPTLQQPVLGICVGMQVMALHSEEEDTACLGIVPARVRRLQHDALHKVPHMGWNNLDGNIDWMPPALEGQQVYYVHSYAMDTGEWTTARTHYTRWFSAALRHENFYGTQFHVEKSGSVGAAILKAFLEL